MLNSAKKYAEIFQNKSIRNLHSQMKEILQDDDPNIAEKIFPFIISGNRWGKTLFIKFLKDKKDTNILLYLRTFIEEDDLLLNILAVDTMASIDIAGRGEIFIELLKHHSEEIKLIAINYLGLDRNVDAIYYLKLQLKSKITSEKMKFEIKKALYRITGKSIYQKKEIQS